MSELDPAVSPMWVVSLWKVDRVTDLLSLSYVVIIRIALEIVE